MSDLQKAAAALGRKGGKKRFAGMTREQKSEVGKKAAAARWAKAALKQKAAPPK